VYLPGICPRSSNAGLDIFIPPAFPDSCPIAEGTKKKKRKGRIEIKGCLVISLQ
jgi:hypothetical protein